MEATHAFDFAGKKTDLIPFNVLPKISIETADKKVQ